LAFKKAIDFIHEIRIEFTGLMFIKIYIKPGLDIIWNIPLIAI